MGIWGVLAEDDPPLREGIARLLERADDIELVARAIHVALANRPRPAEVISQAIWLESSAGPGGWVESAAGSLVETRCLLLTDIEGSTRLLRELGDSYEDLLDEHHRLMRAAIAANGGEEVDTEGDAFFAVFPSAADGVACALAAQRALLAATGPGRPLKVRMGLHVGSLRHGPTGYIGMAIHEAARVAAAGNGAQVLVTHAVRATVADALPVGAFLSELGSFRLKDFPEPQRLYQLRHPDLPQSDAPPRGARALGAPQAPARSFADALASVSGPGAVPFPTLLDMTRHGPFVGRSEELAAVRLACSATAAGWRVVALGGAPGIGKSRLAAEVAASLHGDGATVLFGRNPEQPVAPFQSVVEGLRAYVASAPPGTVPVDASGGELTRLVPEVGAPRPDAGFESDDLLARYRLFEAIGWVLDAAAADRPALVVLDDLHWADRPTLALLAHLLGGSQTSPVVFLVTYRTTDVAPGHPFTGLLADLARDDRVERVLLDGLGDDAVAALAHALAPDSSVVGIAAGTGGNPLFVRELVRQRAAGAGPQPGGVMELVAHRVASLAEATRRTLDVACVAGAEFDAAVVERAGRPEDDVVEALEEAIHAGFVAEVPGGAGRLVFTHALVREALYEQLSDLRRTRLHLRLAEILESVPQIAAAEVLGHLVAAGSLVDVGRLTQCARQAGREATRNLAWEDAAPHFAMAVDASKGLGHERLRVELLVELGDARWMSGSYTAATEAFREAAERASSSGDPDLLADAALGYGARMVGFAGGQVDDALTQWLQQALDGLPADDMARRATVMARLAEARLLVDPSPDVLQLALAAIDAGRRSGDPAALAMTLLRAQVTLWDPDNPRERLALANEARALAESVGDSVGAREAQAWQLIDLFELGEISTVRTEVDAYSSAASELDLPHARWMGRHFESALAHFDGRLDEAEALALEALQLGQAAENPTAGQIFALMLSMIRREQARFSELESAMVSIGDQIPEQRRSWLTGLALLHAEEGRADLAREELDELFADGIAGLRVGNWTWGVALIAEACAAAGATEHAPMLYEALFPHRGRWSSNVGAFLGGFERSLGQLAAMLRRWPVAFDHFERALVAHEQIGAVVWLAHTQQQYACALVDAAEPTDRGRARHLLATAAATADAHGLALVKRRCDDAQLRLGPA